MIIDCVEFVKVDCFRFPDKYLKDEDFVDISIVKRGTPLKKHVFYMFSH